PPPIPRRPTAAPARASRVTPTTASPPPRPPPSPPAGKTGSSGLVLPPGLVVLTRFVEVQVAKAALGFLHDAPALRPFRGVVGLPHFVMEQLTARVAEQALQLRRRVQQSTGTVELLDPLCQRPQQRHQPLGSLRSVRLVAHRYLDYTTGLP